MARQVLPACRGGSARSRGGQTLQDCREPEVSDHPVRAENKVARHFLYSARPPLLQKEGNPDNTFEAVISTGFHWGFVAAFLLLIAGSAQPAGRQVSPDPVAGVFDHLAFRSIGPASMGGRIDDLAVLETHPSTF